MCGDGTNDAPALAQADVGVAMNTGTMAAREAGNMVDLDSDPTKLIEIVEIGKQLLMTRGALPPFQSPTTSPNISRSFRRCSSPLSAAAKPQCHASRDATKRHSVGDHFQCPDHHRADPSPLRGVPTGRRRGDHSAAQSSWSMASAGSSFPS